MKSVLPDTGVIIDLLDGDRTFEKELSSAERIIVTPSVIAAKDRHYTLIPVLPVIRGQK